MVTAALSVGPWRPANNGIGKRIWFLHRDAAEISDRYYWDSRGYLIRYATYETATKAAERLNCGA